MTVKLEGDTDRLLRTLHAAIDIIDASPGGDAREVRARVRAVSLLWAAYDELASSSDPPHDGAHAGIGAHAS